MRLQAKKMHRTIGTGEATRSAGLPLRSLALLW